ncbi:MAG: ATP-binding protein [Gammaproteobacteria bacterium]|nr:ATP-binding protein [Gammaproteobacteria bacterium]
MMYYRRMGGAGSDQQGSNRGMHVSLQPELNTALTALADAVEEFAARESLGGALSINLNLVLDELVTNSVSYALTEVEKPMLELRLRRDGDLVVAEVEDNGAAFDPFKDAPKPDTKKGLDERPIGGLGVFLVMQLTETAHYERAGDVNRIILHMKMET